MTMLFDIIQVILVFGIPIAVQLFWVRIFGGMPILAVLGVGSAAHAYGTSSDGSAVSSSDSGEMSGCAGAEADGFDAGGCDIGGFDFF